MSTVLFFLLGNNFCLGHVLSYLYWLLTTSEYIICMIMCLGDLTICSMFVCILMYMSFSKLF